MTASSDENFSKTWGVDEQTKQELHRQLLTQLAAVTGGLAPDDYLQAWWSWYLNLAADPAKPMQLAQDAWQKSLQFWQFAAQATSAAASSVVAGIPGMPAMPSMPPIPGMPTMPGIPPIPGMPPVPGAAGASSPEPRAPEFSDPAWNVWPYDLLARSYSTWADWMRQVLAAGAQGSQGSSAEANRLRFATEQWLAAASPANFLATNPELLQQTVAESGQNLVRGMQNWLEDATGVLLGRAPQQAKQFKVGRDVAVTPGKVVLRNNLIELLQYTPQTETVYAEPVLITPAWIMKYYILDLSPRNSLVRYLVEKGHTVFVVSWKNPTAVDRDLGMDDYVKLGFFDALEAINRIVPDRKVHAVGYCIGGTLLSICAALMGARGDARLASVTLLAALTEFSDPGELSVFISPSQLTMLEAVMHKAGVLESERMSAAFMMLRSKDLMWTPAVNTYVRGERAKPNDLMAWNSDGTRMPWRMHSEYLQRLYLKNELAQGKFTVNGQPVDLKSIRVPMFVVGTETDHVAPWRAVFKIRGLTSSSDYTFLLTSGGHNAGIVSGPAHPKRRFRALHWTNDHESLSSEEWLSTAPLTAGSWWPHWQQWLVDHSTAEQVAARTTSAGPSSIGQGSDSSTLGDAPGSYVHG